MKSEATQIPALTLEQAIILTGYTGILMSDFYSFHVDVEKRLGRPVYSHEMASAEFFDELKELYRQDFLSILGRLHDNT